MYPYFDYIQNTFDSYGCFSFEFTSENSTRITFNIFSTDYIETVRELFPEVFMTFTVIRTNRENPENNLVLVIFLKK